MDLLALTREFGGLLASSGFDATTLGFPDADKRFMRELAENLSERGKTGHSGRGFRDFTVGISGILGENGDVVHFNFLFWFDPETGTLRVPKVTGRLKDTRLDFVLDENGTLPTSKSIHSALEAERMNRPVQANKDEGIWTNRSRGI